MKSRVEDTIEVRRAGRNSVHGGWVGRGLGKGKDRYQNLVTVKTEGSRWDRPEGRKDMAREARGRP